MNNSRRFGKVLFVAALVGVGVFGAFSAPSKAVIHGCICPYIYAPVQCSNGVTYTNGCFASCAHATGCVPVGPGPIPL